MRFLLFLLGSFFITGLGISNARANGDIVICNQSSGTMYVSHASQWSLRILTDRWYLAGRFIIPSNECTSFADKTGSRYLIYLGVKVEGWLGGFKEYIPSVKTSHNFQSSGSVDLCTRDGPFQFTDTLDNLARCEEGYNVQNFPLYFTIDVQPLNQHEDRVIFLW